MEGVVDVCVAEHFLEGFEAHLFKIMKTAEQNWWLVTMEFIFYKEEFIKNLF